MTNPDHSTPELNEKPEKKGFSTRQKLLAAVGATAVGAGATIFGVSASKGENSEPTESTPSPSDTPTETFEPTPEPSETVEPSPEATEAEVETIPEHLESKEAMEFSEFKELPIEERLEWCSWHSRDLEEIAQIWAEASGNPLDIMPENISPDNTPQEKVIYETYLRRSAKVAHQNDSVFLEKNNIYKMMSCAFFDAENSDRLPVWIDEMDRAGKEGLLWLTPHSYGSQDIGGTPEVTYFEEPREEDGYIRQYIETVWNSNDGRTVNSQGDSVVVEYTDYKGNEKIAHVVDS